MQKESRRSKSEVPFSDHLRSRSTNIDDCTLKRLSLSLIMCKLFCNLSLRCSAAGSPPTSTICGFWSTPPWECERQIAISSRVFELSLRLKLLTTYDSSDEKTSRLHSLFIAYAVFWPVQSFFEFLESILNFWCLEMTRNANRNIRNWINWEF